MGSPLAVETGIAARLAAADAALVVETCRPSKMLDLHAWCEHVGDEGFVTMGGSDAVYLFEVYLVVPERAGMEVGRENLAPYLAQTTAQDAKSIRGALLADTTLGGAADDIRNITLIRAGRLEMGVDVERYGAVWRVEVMAQ